MLGTHGIAILLLEEPISRYENMLPFAVPYQRGRDEVEKGLVLMRERARQRNPVLSVFPRPTLPYLHRLISTHATAPATFSNISTSGTPSLPSPSEKQICMPALSTSTLLRPSCCFRVARVAWKGPHGECLLLRPKPCAWPLTIQHLSSSACMPVLLGFDNEPGALKIGAAMVK